MNSLNQLVYDILELLKANQISHDSDIDERQVIFHINNERAFIIRDTLKKGGSIDQQLIQDLGCLELEEADPSDCCVDTGCTVLRTKLELPRFIDTYGSNGITRVGTINKINFPLFLVNYEQFVYSGEGKYNHRGAWVTLLNKRIYLKSKEPKFNLLDDINVRGLLEDPTEAANFRCPDDSPCFTFDDEYPIHGWMIPVMKERILKRFGIVFNVPKDTSNDAADDTNGIQKQ